MATLTTFTANTQIKSAEVNANFTGLSDGTMNTDHASLQVFRDEALFDFVNSGGIWTADSAGVNRNASMTALLATIDGWRAAVGAVTARTFTASKDTYIDLLRTAGAFALVYTEVANNAASPALASNSLRLGIIVTGATTIATANSINQGQQDRVLPIASSIPYAVADSLGNVICNRDPNSKLLGYRQILASQASIGNAYVNITGLSIAVLVPTGRKIKITIFGPQIFSSGASDRANMAIRESTTNLNTGYFQAPTSALGGTTAMVEAIVSPSAGLHTYLFSLSNTGGATTLTLFSDTTTGQAFIKVELV